jgi:hypothetical protein
MNTKNKLILVASLGIISCFSFCIYFMDFLEGLIMATTGSIAIIVLLYINLIILSKIKNLALDVKDGGKK